MSYQRTKTIGAMVYLVLFLLVFGRVLAQNSDDCQAIEECQALLEKYEGEIKQHEQNINRTQREEKNLKNRIYLIREKITKLEKEILRSEIIVNDLKVQIEDTTLSIEKKTREIERHRAQLAEILRDVYLEDQKSILEIVLEGEDISDFFNNLVALEALSLKNQEILQSIKNLKLELQTQQQTLKEEKGDWQKNKEIQILEKAQSQKTKTEQEWLLNKTRGEEVEYQKLLATSQEAARQIRERIFELIGVVEAPTFEEALELARYVEKVTRVRPALLLAVLTQESSIGKNVGQCYLKNPETGEGIAVKSGKKIARVMKPSRDVPHFLAITKGVGRDPYNTLVSCPMSFGWGGAMGPAQFIPSTWVLYQDKVTQITGKPADPWSIKDAFLAAGLLLKDAGAVRQNTEAEWRAAMIYFSGSTNVKYRFYGDSVIDLAKDYEKDIKTLESI